MLHTHTLKLTTSSPTLGTVYSFDTVAKNPKQFSQGRFELATRATSSIASPSTNSIAGSSGASLAPGALSHIEPEALVHAFHSNADRNGSLSLAAFVSVFKKLAPEVPEIAFVNLFHAFDADGNDVVDSSEFVAGAVVLCGGDRDDKIRLSFELLDVDQSGVLEQAEVEQYMRSVFRVVANAQPDVFVRNGVSPDDLAKVTAEAAMGYADVDKNGTISFEEFRNWMLSKNGSTFVPGAAAAPADSNVAAVVRSASPSVGSLEQIRAFTGLGDLSADEVIDCFINEAADERGIVDRRGFSRALGSIARSTGRDPHSFPPGMADALFDAVDTDGSGGCDVEELGSAFSVLCQGSRDERCIAAFNMWDEDGDGFLSAEEMSKLLTSVFKVLYASDPSIRDQMGVGPEELGRITAQDAVDSMDADSDGRVSFSEFREWYSKPSSSLMPSTAPKSASTAPSIPDTSFSVSSDDAADASWVTLEETRRLTGLGRFNPGVVMEAFAVVADEEGMVSRDDFIETLRRLKPRNLDARDEDRSRLVRDRLFALYAEGDRIDFSILASALAMLSGGEAEEKKRAVFELIDVDQSGTVEREEFLRFMSSTMRVLYETHPGTRERIGVGPEQLAEAVTEDAFERFDNNHDGRLSYDEFSAYWESDSGSTLNTSTEHLDKGNSQTLERTRALLGLDRYPIDDLFDTVSSSADHKGWISLSQFQKVLQTLAKHNRDFTPAQERELDELLDSLYHVFDTDRNGYVDFPELAAGLSVLCGGSNDAKAAAAFRLFDVDGNGTITLKGMQDYLTAVFKTMMEVGGDEVRQKMGGASCEDIARETAEAVFGEADLNSDGTLSYEEWQRFYSGDSGKVLASVVDQAPTFIPIDEVKRRTGLSLMTPAECFEHFAHAADDKGELSKSSFVSVFERISPQPHDARLHLCIDSLFHILDANGDGRLDYVELSTGLSVLTGGSKKEKLASAFALLDLDGNGTIDRDELERYCTSVYRVMYSDPQSKQRLGGKSISQLAKETADEVMLQAHLTTPGQLTLEEFERWIEGDSTGGALVEPASRVATDASSWLTIFEMARLTNMRSYETEELFERFAACASVQGELSRAAFTECVQKIMLEGPRLSPDDALRAEIACDRLFDALDINHDGHVDFQELASGLSILAGGSRDDKVRAAFKLYDTNSDGSISKNEMYQYLLSVYRVLFRSQPDIERQMNGVSAEELARVTTDEAFDVADANNDGELSFEEFRDWYASDEPVKTTSSEVPPLIPESRRRRRAAPEPVAILKEKEEETQAATPTLEELQNLRSETGLDTLSPSEAFEFLARFADPRTHVLSPGAFFAALSQIAPSHSGDRHHLAVATQTIFSLFDNDHNGAVDMRELAAGLAILSTATQSRGSTSVEDNADSLFSIFSQDDKFIRQVDCERLLTTVFRILIITDAASREIARNNSPEDLARITAHSMIAQADDNHDGLISKEEFRKFVLSDAGHALSDLVRASQPTSVQALGGLEGVRKLTGLQSVQSEDVFALVESEANERFELTRNGFYNVVNSIAPRYADRGMLKLVADLLFDAVDVDQNHMVSFHEMAAALSILCKGTKEERAEDLFELFDWDGDGFVTAEELMFYLRAVFRLLKACEPTTYGHIDVEQVAEATSLQIIRDADVSGDGVVSMEEFLRWTSSGDNQLTVTGFVERAAVGHAAASVGAVDIDQCRDILGLKNFTAEEVFDAIARRANQTGEVSRHDFKHVMMVFAKRAGDPSRAGTLLDSLFETMDLNHNGKLDFAEVASGMSVMIGGDTMDKLRSAMQLFDFDQNGKISRDEMITYLTSVFSVVLATQPDAQLQVGNIDPETLARATCDEAFANADIDHDGQLDFNEFCAWVLGDYKGAATKRIMDTAPVALSLTEIRRISGLDKHKPEIVFQALAREADDHGELSRGAFFAAFQRFASRNLGPAEAGRVRVVLGRLFELFDVDGSGSVSFSELAAGLAVLCSGTKQEKTRAAFEAVGQGERLNRDEASVLLRSVFRVLLETVPGAKDKVEDVSADELADATATQCFLEFDPRGTGYVSIDDFHQFFDHEFF